MKNQLSGIRTSVKSVLTAATFAIALVITAFPINAMATDKAKETSPIDVKYLGLVDARPVFQVNIDNASADDIFFSLKDEEGNVIYSERFKDKVLSRKFQLNLNDASNVKVIMSLFSKNQKKSESFEISNVTTVVENVVVTKVR